MNWQRSFYTSFAKFTWAEALKRLLPNRGRKMVLQRKDLVSGASQGFGPLTVMQWAAII